MTFLFNSDQGSQQGLLAAGYRDGRGRATNNACIGRPWRTVKWGHSRPNPAADARQLHQ